jgi:hypothetical protein
MHATRCTLSLFAFVLLSSTPAIAQAPDTGSAPPIGPAPRRVVVNLRDRTLSLFEEGKVVRMFPVAVGAPQTMAARLVVLGWSCDAARGRHHGSLEVMAERQ